MVRCNSILLLVLPGEGGKGQKISQRVARVGEKGNGKCWVGGAGAPFSTPTHRLSRSSLGKLLKESPWPDPH